MAMFIVSAQGGRKKTHHGRSLGNLRAGSFQASLVPHLLDREPEGWPGVADLSACPEAEKALEGDSNGCL